MGRFRLPRRTFLRGLGGAALALPALELMQPATAHAQTPPIPKRFAFLFCGVSIGRHLNSVDDTRDAFVPAAQGTGYELTYALSPLAGRQRAQVAPNLAYNAMLASTIDYDSVLGEVSVVSGMKIPWNTGSGVPAGGRARKFHARSLCPAICGVRGSSDETLQSVEDGARGPTSDWVIADTIAGDAPHRVLAYKVQAENYRGDAGGNGGNRGRISYRLNSTGSLVAVPPVVSPRLAYESLFANFTPADPVEAERARFELRRRKSIIDLVRERTSSLMPRLGEVDRQRLNRHLDEVRALELRLQAVEPVAAGACVVPPHPGNDPPIGASTPYGEPVPADAQYSNEELRAQVLFDLIHMAFACDQSRVASVMLTHAQCYLNMRPILGHPVDFHEASHAGSIRNGISDLHVMSDGVAWHVKHFARLVSKLRDTQEVDGSSLLDHSALVLAFEGGHGFDPEGNDRGSHSTEGMAWLIAGRAGGLNAGGGRHIVAAGQHPVKVTISAMRAVGHPTEQLGEVSGSIGGLFG